MAKQKDNQVSEKKAKKKFRNPLLFFKEVYYELKKVTWPSKKELKVNTATVLIVTLISAVVIGLLDWGMSSLYKLVIGG